MCILRIHINVVCLFALMIYVPANNFSVMLGHFLVLKQSIKCLAQGHYKCLLMFIRPSYAHYIKTNETIYEYTQG